MRSSVSRSEPVLKRYKAYQRCLDSIKAWLDNFFSLSLDMYTRLSFTTYSQLFYVVVGLHKLTTLKDTAWDSAAAREVVDPSTTLDRIAHTFEQLRALQPPLAKGKDEALAFGLNKFLNLKIAWQNDLASRGSEDRTISETDMIGDPQAQFLPSPMDCFDFYTLPGFLEDASWQ